MLRIAAWPIETADRFAALPVAAVARAVLDCERRVRNDAGAVCEALHAAVPRVDDRRARAYLLSVRRAVHNGTSPLPDPPPWVCAALAAESRLLGLLAGERESRLGLAQARAAFVRHHDAELERQRRELESIASGWGFQRALAVANPVVAQQLAVLAASSKASPSRHRRLEATLFHYVMRAAGRPTPHGAWAGAVAVAPADTAPADADGAAGGLVVTPAARRYECTVDLRPFAVILRALSRRSRYRRRYPLRLNPTLRRCNGGWRYERERDEVSEWVLLPHHPLYDAVIRYFEDFVAKIPEPLIRALGKVAEDASEHEDAGRAILERLVDGLIDRDVLRNEVRMPAVSRSAWSALHAAARKLIGQDVTCWRRAIRRMRRLCRRLGASFERLSPHCVLRICEAMARETQVLWDAAGLPGAWRGPLARVEMRPPFDVSWTGDLRGRLQASVASFLAFHEWDGGAELYRRLTMQDVIRASEGGRELPLRQVLDAVVPGWPLHRGPEPLVAAEPLDAPDSDCREMLFARFGEAGPLKRQAMAYCESWDRRLARVCRRRHHALARIPRAPRHPVGSGGVVLLRLATSGECWIGPARPEPASFTPCTGRPGSTGEVARRVLRDWTRTAVRAGVTPVEIVGGDAMNPNAALRDVVCGTMLDPHGPPGAGIHHVSLIVDPEECRGWLRHPRAPGLSVPVYNAPAAMGFGDGCTRLLLTLARAHGWEFLSFGFPASHAERVQWQHLPRLVLCDQVVLSPERWTLDVRALTRLTGLRGAERYLAWREEVEARGIPALAYVRCGPAANELLMRTDSPIAVRCLFDTLAVGAPWISLTELAGATNQWPVRDAAGQHYAAELGVTWLDDTHWTATVPRDQRARATPRLAPSRRAETHANL